MMKLVASVLYRLELAFRFQKERRFRFSPSCRNHAVHYIIRRIPRWGDAGFFSNWMFVLTHMAYARQNGWIPVVDMRNYRTLYSEPGAVNGSKNAWEYYFRQPGVGTREAYRSGNFILSDGCGPRPEWKPFSETDDAVELIPTQADFLRRIVQTDMQIRPEILASFVRWKADRFTGKRVLGVHWRGTDKRTPPPGHRPTPPQERLSDAIARVVRRRPYDLVFLASDEIGVSESVRTASGLPVVMADACRMETGHSTGLHNDPAKPRRPLHRYLLGLEVLRDAWLLSRCDGLVHGHSNVTNAAVLLRDGPFDDDELI